MEHITVLMRVASNEDIDFFTAILQIEYVALFCDWNYLILAIILECLIGDTYVLLGGLLFVNMNAKHDLCCDQTDTPPLFWRICCSDFHHLGPHDSRPQSAL